MVYRWSLPFDAPSRSDALADRLNEADDLPPSWRGLVAVVRLWNVLLVVAVTIGFVLFGLTAVATLALFAVIDLTPMAPLYCASLAVGCVAVNRGSQRLQERLFERLLRGRAVIVGSVGGGGPVALPAVREELPDEQP